MTDNTSAAINTSQWNKRNMWVNQSEELTTRPGQDQLCSFTAFPATTKQDPKGSFTAKSQFADSVQHYVLMGVRAPFSDTLEMLVMEENLSNTKRKQVLPLGANRPIRAMTGAVVNGQVIISGPDIPTLWGYTGSGIVIAKSERSVNPSLQTLSMPRGICVSWVDRCVIAQGEALFISDPMAPRTYTADGFLALPGVVYGLHVTDVGDLVAVTSEGVYSLNSQSVAQGAGIVGSVNKLSNYKANDYNQSAMTPFGIYGLTKRGYKRIDIDTSDEIPLSDKRFVRSLSDMISFPDYRSGKVWQTDTGMAIAIGSIDKNANDTFEGGVCMVDLYQGLRSWWTPSKMKKLNGVLTSREGETLFLFTANNEIVPGTNHNMGAVMQFHLDRDTVVGDQIPAGQEYKIDISYSGSIAGLVPYNPEFQPVVRAIFMKADNGGKVVKVAVRGEYEKKNGTLQQITTEANGVVINGVTVWGPINNTDKLKTVELEGNRFQFAKRTDDISIEVQAAGGRVRIGGVSFASRGYGQRRPV